MLVGLLLTASSRDKQDALHTLLRNSLSEGVEKMDKIRADILGAIEQFQANNTLPLSHHKFSMLLCELAKKSEEVIRTQMLRSLAYDGMTARKSRIPDPYKQTFDWVFRDPKIRFKDWLEADSAKDIYWVSGKPGSGKTTLVNFLYNHKKTRENLQVWAGPKTQLVLGCHFF